MSRNQALSTSAFGANDDEALGGPSPACVWVVEDDPELRRLVAHRLRREGHEVLELESGVELEEGLERVFDVDADAERAPPALILADLSLPGLDGLAALARLRSLDFEIPVVLMTAFPGPEVYDQARRLGVAAVFEKPFSLSELCSVIGALAPPMRPHRRARLAR